MNMHQHPLGELLRNIESGLHEMKRATREAQIGQESQTAQLVDGFTSLQKEMEGQTECLARLKVISLLAELNGLTELIASEEELLRSYSRDESNRIDQFDRLFMESIERVQDKRNERVAKLLEPVYEVLDLDGDELIEARSERYVAHLAEFAEVVSAQIGEREEIIRERLERLRTLLTELRAERDRTNQELARVRLSGQRRVRPHLLEVPFYEVTIAGPDGSRVEWYAPGKVTKARGGSDFIEFVADERLKDVAERLGRAEGGRIGFQEEQSENANVDVGDGLSDGPFDSTHQGVLAGILLDQEIRVGDIAWRGSDPELNSAEVPE